MIVGRLEHSYCVGLVVFDAGEFLLFRIGIVVNVVLWEGYVCGGLRFIIFSLMVMLF